ncbi:uncharacterized protein LOC123685369 [Harmonia axyridis]|uniref:uncharacterized protein LOC123685369 n=1 Tax=Harmonia axyridis TaxID=115357 RepID=UPI001E2767E0|nr:uncharacterized protein LOC123685369 [Harmonia axyridis]
MEEREVTIEMQEREEIIKMKDCKLCKNEETLEYHLGKFLHARVKGRIFMKVIIELIYQLFQEGKDYVQILHILNKAPNIKAIIRAFSPNREFISPVRVKRSKEFAINHLKLLMWELRHYVSITINYIICSQYDRANSHRGIHKFNSIFSHARHTTISHHNHNPIHRSITRIPSHAQNIRTTHAPLSRTKHAPLSRTTDALHTRTSTIIFRSLVAFNLADTTRIRYDGTTKPCYNYKVLTMLKENYGFKCHREFHLGGSGNHNTFVIALHESAKIPVGIKQYFVKKVLQAGLDALGPETKTQTHGIPQGICCDGTQSLKVFAEDAPTVWRRVDAFVRDKRTLANDIVESGEETMHRNYNPDFKFYTVCFMYYRCKNGILAEPESVTDTLRSMISSNDTTSILLIQLHFGTVLYHPTLPLFLHFPTALRKLSKAKEKTFYRCHNGYITCKTPFIGDRFENISYFLFILC